MKFNIENNMVVIGEVSMYDNDTNELLLKKRNAVHPQNMSRIIARALAGESNSSIYRIAFGNGGTVTDPTGKIIFNPPNDGSSGSWESRLYNETYSEIVDSRSPFFGNDPGSSEPGNIRTGGGAFPDDDPAGGGIVSSEVGNKSNVVVTVYLNRNEPSGQLETINDFGISIDENERGFIFDELGLYSSGKPASATNGYSSLYVGNKTSEDSTLLEPNKLYDFEYEVDGVHRSTTIRTPPGGSGPSNTFTYGDLCEALNTNLWTVSGDNFSQYAFMFISDRSETGEYPSIINKESYGFLTIQSLNVGSTSTVELFCGEPSGATDDLFNTLVIGVCENININKTDGSDAGVMNDPTVPTNERERLLTHLIFPPITKLADKSIRIVYTLTISVSKTNNSQVHQTLP